MVPDKPRDLLPKRSLDTWVLMRQPAFIGLRGLRMDIHFLAFSTQILPFLPKSLNYCVQIVLLYKKYDESALLQQGCSNVATHSGGQDEDRVFPYDISGIGY